MNMVLGIFNVTEHVGAHGGECKIWGYLIAAQRVGCIGRMKHGGNVPVCLGWFGDIFGIVFQCMTFEDIQPVGRNEPFLIVLHSEEKEHQKAKHRYECDGPGACSQ